ncbi:MAG: DNA polymerase III subunit gamma/tau [Dongiaceae bacterium]
MAKKSDKSSGANDGTANDGVSKKAPAASARVAEADGPQQYRVLARKYRPRNFAELIGQDAMVRTLANAIAQGRLAHAFVLTGVRGVGKTTTARILARAFNCVGPDGKGGPTAEPCGVCAPCVAIAEDRHVDVIEMDAASRTGVADIRELIEGVRYRPVEARYKIYIIDEVHMLSNNAFNALLKTLEEPPGHVKFIFATTEIRKVPVTVLSRCQRFDLRRVDAETLAAHFGRLAGIEGATIAPAALALIARAADGSVRDGLSLLDQAIARSEGEIGEAGVRDMLGLADRTQLFELYARLMKGEAKAALDQTAQLYRAGADPVQLLQDLLELTHWLTRVKLTPEVADDPAVPQAERERGRAMAETLALPVLSRAWQMLLKGLAETQAAPQPLQALEMALIRLLHAAEMPTPGEILRELESAPAAGASAPPGPRAAAAPASRPGAPASAVGTPLRGNDGRGTGGRGTGDRPTAALAVESDPQAPAAPALPPLPQSFAELVELASKRREVMLHAQLVGDVHLVHYEPGRIEFRPGPNAPANLASRLGSLLQEWTGQRWVIAISQGPGAATLKEQADAVRAATERSALAHPLVQAALASFPGAVLEAVRDLTEPPAAAPIAAAEGAGGLDEGIDGLDEGAEGAGENDAAIAFDETDNDEDPL